MNEVRNEEREEQIMNQIASLMVDRKNDLLDKLDKKYRDHADFAALTIFNAMSASSGHIKQCHKELSVKQLAELVLACTKIAVEVYTVGIQENEKAENRPSTTLVDLLT